MILLLSFMPSSPRFLLSKGRDAEALWALAWLRGAHADIRWEFQQIQDNVQRQVCVCGATAECGCSQPLRAWVPFPGEWGTSSPTAWCHSTQP